MRFKAPRSISPSPVRRKPRRRSTFGVQSDSEESSHSDDASDSSFSDSGSSDAESIISSPPSDSEVLKKLPQPPRTLTSAEQRLTEIVAAIRLRTRHHDPYEDWERQTRVDAFRTARKEQNATQSRFHHEQDQARNAELQRRAALHAQEMQEVNARLEGLRVKQQADEEKLRVAMEERQKRIWEGIEGVIKAEEDKVRAVLEEERKLREEEERKRIEAEMRAKALEAKRLAEESKKAEEEKKAAEEKEKREKEEAERQRVQAAQEQQEATEEKARAELGITKPSEDWKSAHDHLIDMKTNTMRTVKADPTGKAEWSKWRRQITPKIGQITDDEKEINRISLQLYQILHPPGGAAAHHPAIYKALLSSLAKAILLQAETEVTAEKKSARPLARVAFSLLETLDGFAEVFFSKLVQRAGGWPVPYMVPPDIGAGGGPGANDEQRKKAVAHDARRRAMGYRKAGNGSNGDELETAAEYSARVSGLMRVYFHILKFPPQQQQKPLHALFRLPRYWTWFVRILGDKSMLGTATGAQLIYTALDVMGSHARRIWGHQWNKLLELVYEGVTKGFDAGKTIGGSSAEGMAARMRIQLEVERILFGQDS